MDSISPWVAFMAGLASLLSPCTIPMLPIYIASLAGPEVLQKGTAGRRLSIFIHSVSFITGFALVFILMGTGAGLVGSIVKSNFPLVRLISGSFMILFGSYMLAATKISWLNYEKRLNTNASFATGYVRSFILGILFTLVWTPCVGPVLGGILTLAVNSGSGWHGGFLLALYSLGIGLPFLIFGLAYNSLLPLIKRINRYSTYIYVVSGIILVALGILILLNKLTWLSAHLNVIK
jgi:cytochrome c-type biogenesis protein